MVVSEILFHLIKSNYFLESYSPQIDIWQEGSKHKA